MCDVIICYTKKEQTMDVHQPNKSEIQKKKAICFVDLKQEKEVQGGRRGAKRCEVLLRYIAETHQRTLSKNSKNVCSSLLHHLTLFAKHEVFVKEISEEFLIEFSQYLLRTVKPSSAKTYLQKLHALLCSSLNPYRTSNPMLPISQLIPSSPASTRAFLTGEEILRLKNTPCPHFNTKQAFLFACFTGLRLSDIETLRWSDIRVSGGSTTIVKMQVKTKRSITIPLNIDALKLLPSRKDASDDFVFQLYSRATISSDLRIWACAAGIEKHISFHVSRHTFATLALTAGVEIYTVSKLCGHANVRTTEIYAHLLDSTLKDGVGRISLFMQKVSEISIREGSIGNLTYR